jgi:hypothetical protein
VTDPELDARLLELERRVAVLEQGAQIRSGAAVTQPTGSTKLESAREFLNSKAARAAVDKALVIAVWLERNGSVGLTTDEISAGFESAKEPLTANPSDLLYQNGRRGFMAPNREKKDGAKSWYVTTTGENFVDKGLKG